MPAAVAGLLMVVLLAVCIAPGAARSDIADAPPAVHGGSESRRALQHEILNNVRSELDQLEARMAAGSLAEEQLSELRARVVDTSGKIRGLIAELSPRAAALNAQLAQLGPRPAEGEPPEAEATAHEREDRTRALAELQATINLAEATLVRATQVATAINDQRREAFANEVFAHTYSLLSPRLWVDAAAGLPESLANGRRIFGEWLVKAKERARDGVAWTSLSGLVVWAGLSFLQRRFLPQMTNRSRDEADPPRLRRALKALSLMVGVSLPIILAFLAVFAGLDAQGLTEGRMEVVVVWLLFSGGFVVFMRALARALFAPNVPQWRLFPMDDDTARHLYRSSVRLTLVILAGELAQVVVGAIDASLALVALVEGLSTLAVALVMFWSLQGLRRRVRPVEDDFGPYVSADPQVWTLVRVAAWLATLVIIAAVLTGFIAFAAFLVDQMVWYASVIGLLFIVATLVDEIAIEMPKRNTRVSLVLQTSVGLRRRTLEQIGILFAGVAKLLLFAIGVLLILAPWGLESNDVFSLSLFNFIQNGFSIGEVRLSPVALLSAVFTFAVTLAIGRMIQGWLSTRFLPATGMDPGIRNSIATGVGYLAFFLAAGLASASLGLGLERLTIVAGALSVGIGFGLQSIVNNFVSGLILLWERPIKVGDWVVVGQDEGYVKRINVRATEIETFDRAAVIVPNSSLVSGTVVNWLHRDRIGRVIISVGVSYRADPDEVREMMLKCAKDHPQVLETPAPLVLLRAFEPAMLRFELRCFIGNVESRLSVSSELSFAVLRALRDKDLVPVRPMALEEWASGRSTTVGGDALHSHQLHQGNDGTTP
ncbi:DUF3772 domain-containing protein [Pseudochelatococcus sp. B33]